jgi:selenocysteine lyase/cysteine desulfurase
MWDRLRAQFPVTERYAYLNHAGLSPVPTVALEAVRASVESQALHGLARIDEWEAGIESVRSASARLLGAGPDEIGFVRNTSHGLSLVAAGIDWRPGDVVLCATSEEYPSNVYPWMRLAARGVELRAVPAPGGRVEPKAFAEAGDARTRLVTVSSVQYASGVRVDLAALGELCHARGWLLCVDGIQSVGAIPLDCEALGVHFLAADSHKWMLGLPGIGVFYVRRGVALEPALVGWRSTKEALNFDQVKLDLRDDAARFEEGNVPYALIEGMGASIRLLLELGMDRVWERLQALGDHLIARVDRGGHALRSPRDARSGSVVFVPRAGDPVRLAENLGEQGIVVSCRRGAIRASPHAYNTVDELDRLMDAVEAT